MIVNIVHVSVRSEYISQFLEATRVNHANSIKEKGNLRFDVLQDFTDPSKFILYEAYATEDAVARHKEMAHYLTWRDTVAPWMAKPREGFKHKMIFPQSSESPT